MSKFSVAQLGSPGSRGFYYYAATVDIREPGARSWHNLRIAVTMDRDESFVLSSVATQAFGVRVSNPPGGIVGIEVKFSDIETGSLRTSDELDDTCQIVDPAAFQGLPADIGIVLGRWFLDKHFAVSNVHAATMNLRLKSRGCSSVP